MSFIWEALDVIKYYVTWLPSRELLLVHPAHIRKSKKFFILIEKGQKIHKTWRIK